jgi:excisionase family DNA binding protein
MPFTMEVQRMNNPDLVDVHEGQRITGLEPQTIYRLARQGRLKSFRVLNRALRFERSDLEALVRQQSVATR